MLASVRSVQVGRVGPHPAGDGRRTAIDKRPVSGLVAAGRLGLAGDEQADKRHHGGPDKAVYVYATEDATWWEAALGRSLAAGAFGENLTTSGLDVTGAVIGERWHIGSCELQVAWPRQPCRNFAAFWDLPDLVARFTAAGRPGAYCRVSVPGTLTAGDAVTVVDRPAHGLTVGQVFRARNGERALVARFLDAPELPEEARTWARRILTGR